VVALMHNSERRTTFGATGRALVESAYSWEGCGNRLSRILEEKMLVC
jgi:glycosyltransferase involved in cell wall biosynthesis